MVASTVGKLAARFFWFMSFVMALGALVSFFTWGLNALEISSIFSRMYGADAWLPFKNLIGCSIGCVVLSHMSTHLYSRAIIVAEQERMLNK
ncbi:hypothetical protein QO021_28425 (plasmid) [Pseudomonas amygdali pv. lachrymans]|uniref:hypothetical protein n=1 Tax=Pseudomonas amygdali TaxID=47877 RepID=UPI0006B944E3|nr:hypothetical protein [Pseudomonas amygdali]RMM39080.1 hypothetical protein ALQ79_200383 [Pseudomonas amygdali pv. lachrymans]WIO61485.1 hypothetical protein QO021_28425 [Pseudomonas amygdali pv. lachrymans]